MSQSTFSATYTCKAEVLEKFKRLLNNNVVEEAKLCMDSSRCIALVKVKVTLTDNCQVTDNFISVDAAKYKGRYRAYINKISRRAIYDFNDGRYKGELLKYALMTLIDDENREIDVWSLSSKSINGASILALGNSNGLIIIAPILSCNDKVKSFETILKKVKGNNSIIDVAVDVPSTVLEEWIRELNIKFR